MNIAEFHQAARLALPGWFKVSIEQYSTEAAPKFCVITNELDDVARGEGAKPEEAIRKCKQKQAQQRADKIEAAKKLLESIS